MFRSSVGTGCRRRHPARERGPLVEAADGRRAPEGVRQDEPQGVHLAEGVRRGAGGGDHPHATRPARDGPLGCGADDARCGEAPVGQTDDEAQHQGRRDPLELDEGATPRHSASMTRSVEPPVKCPSFVFTYNPRLATSVDRKGPVHTIETTVVFPQLTNQSLRTRALPNGPTHTLEHTTPRRTRSNTTTHR